MNPHKCGLYCLYPEQTFCSSEHLPKTFIKLCLNFHNFFYKFILEMNCNGLWLMQSDKVTASLFIPIFYIWQLSSWRHNTWRKLLKETNIGFGTMISNIIVYASLDYRRKEIPWQKGMMTWSCLLLSSQETQISRTERSSHEIYSSKVDSQRHSSSRQSPPPCGYPVNGYNKHSMASVGDQNFIH